MVGKHKKHVPVEGEERNSQPDPASSDHPKEMEVPSDSSQTPEPVPAPAETPTATPAEETVDSVKNRLLRLQADFDNYRRRTVREKGEMFQRATEDLIQEILPVLDHLDLALQSSEKEGASASFVEGIRLVRDQMFAVLGKFGLSVMEAEGKDFDPHRHEAISQLSSDAVASNKVMTQTRPGYMLGDRLLRPAQVVVSSGKPGDSGDAEPKKSEA